MKDLCLVYNLKSVYNLGGTGQNHFGRKERKWLPQALQELFVCFPLSKCLEGGLHSWCQSQAIRANGSTRLYVGRV